MWHWLAPRSCTFSLAKPVPPVSLIRVTYKNMSTTIENENTLSSPAASSKLDQSTYEIIRSRLNTHAADLKSRLDQLNEARRNVFGSIETKLLATERISTNNNCVPRDIVAIGTRVLFGYNVQMGLRAETNVEDVLAVYSLKDGTFHSEGIDLLADPTFLADFRQLYKYYRKTTFSKFFVRGTYLYLVFQVGKSSSDIKAFKWLIDGDELKYVDSRSDHEVRYPSQHDFEWKRTHRDLHRHGAHPHISIEERIFVETVGGDLTIKVEDNTELGEGIYAELVEDPDQTLDDAEIFYAIVGDLILLKMRPYQEEQFRYLVYSEKLKEVKRLDAIANACVFLPEGHGLIFSNGYYLQTGEHKTFDSFGPSADTGTSSPSLQYERRIASPNGEDYLYVFHNCDSGAYVLLSYNVIEQRVATPIVCHGFSQFDNGHLVFFKSGGEPQKHHALQMWQTPFVGDDFAPDTDTTSLLYKIGNQDIVRGMAECHEIIGLTERDDSYENLYVDLVKKSTDVLDAYYWLNNDDTFHLDVALTEVKGAANAAVEEFEKVVRVRANTKQQFEDAATHADQTVRAITSRRYEHINDFVASLAELRQVRGELIALKELRYIDLESVEKLEQIIVDNSDRQSLHCVEFLLRDDSLTPYVTAVEARRARIDQLTKVSEAKQLEGEIGDSSNELEMLIDIVSNLKIDDATQRTDIIDTISGIYSQVNQARAALRKKTQELMSVEGKAEFHSQVKLLNQAVVNFLDVCDTPEKCDEYLTKLMVQIEELEGRFAEFDDFVLELSEKREEVYSAFDGKKVSLVEARNKRATTLQSAAERILKGIETRVGQLDSVNEIHSYFAADLMVEKVRDIVENLTELEDTVKVDDIQSRLKTIREDAVRQLKDRQELFVGGENVIQFGKHQFSVNVQDLDLTTVMKNDRMQYHLTGTNFLEEISDADFLATVDVWSQDYVSENADVYRAEYLAYQMLREFGRQAAMAGNGSASERVAAIGQVGGGTQAVHELLTMSGEELTSIVQKFMSPRHLEGYVKGVHDHDAAKILRGLLELQSSIGQLQYPSQARALAEFAWTWQPTPELASLKATLEPQLLELGQIAAVFPDMDGRAQFAPAVRELVAAVAELVTAREFAGELGTSASIDAATEFLLTQTTNSSPFPVSERVVEIRNDFFEHLRRNEAQESFHQALDRLGDAGAIAKLRVLRNWASAFVSQRDPQDVEFVDELGVYLLAELDVGGPASDREDNGDNPSTTREVLQGSDVREITGLVGDHGSLPESGAPYRLRYSDFVARLASFESNTVPRYNRYVERKKQLLEEKRVSMRLEEFKPRVLTSFVRNKLIDQVYLPLIGDNLAKQMGVVGESKRTDLMGLLLLISPPGYGKTTLMEYVANRLGLTFMKINGPAIGHAVTSLDPAEAPNASAREEIDKLNLSLEMGDNVMIYLDDIQHCNPEFLQKFISLCDGQRKIEGVYAGKTRTYDLRGRKVAVVMAGNPYTESGEKFQIPDMLANRADTYNLGDVIGSDGGTAADVFRMSYIENALTSSPTLGQLASRSQSDVYSILKMAESSLEGTPVSTTDADLDGNYSAEELNEFVSVMQKLMRVRDIVLAVNDQYITSAAQADAYRTEPPFKLQGSYRDMNKIAERIVPIMNDAELESLVQSHYENQAQTLTTGAEANLLKLRELLGTLNEEEQARWDDIKKTFARNLLLGGEGSDRLAQVIAQMTQFSEGLGDIKSVLAEGLSQLSNAAAKQASTPEPVTPAEAGESKQLAVALGHLSSFNDNLSKIGESLSQMQGTVAGSSNGAGLATPSSQQVQVVYKVPRVFLDVIKAQFMIMERWLEPVIQLSEKQGADTDALAKNVDLAFKRYEALIERMETAAGDA